MCFVSEQRVLNLQPWFEQIFFFERNGLNKIVFVQFCIGKTSKASCSVKSGEISVEHEHRRPFLPCPVWLLASSRSSVLIQRASRARQSLVRPAHVHVRLQQSCSGATGKAKEEWRAWRKLGRRRTPWMAGAPSSRPSMQVLCPSDVLPVGPPIPTRHRAALIQCSPGARMRAAASEHAWSRSRHGRQPFAAQQSK